MQLMSRRDTELRSQQGFTLLELIIAIAIAAIGAGSVIPYLQQQKKQADVDAYANQLEAGLTSLKSNLQTRQKRCKINFPDKATSWEGITAQELENLAIDHPTHCAQPDALYKWNGQAISTTNTALRLVNRKGTISPSKNEDIRITITPASVEIASVGGIVQQHSDHQTEPLTMVIYSRTLDRMNRGFLRCLQLEIMTGLLTRGTWSRIDNSCSQNA